MKLKQFKISSDSGSKAQNLDKKWGRSLEEDQLVNIGLGKFLSSAGPVERNILVIKGILERLLLIRDFFAVQTNYRFYASSLLILYEGYCPAELGSQVNLKHPKIITNRRYFLNNISQF